MASPSPWLIVAGDFATTGGMDRANLALASRLARQGSPTYAVGHRLESDGSPIRWIRAPRPWGRHLLGAPILDRMGRRWASRLGPDARIVVNGGNCLAPNAINWVHYLHASYQNPAPTIRRRLWDRRQLRNERIALTRQTSRIIANSQRTRDQIVHHYEVDPGTIAVRYYGIDAERFRPLDPEERARSRQALGIGTAGGETAPVAAFVGALGDDRKGFPTLAEAWALADRRSGGLWDARLLVIGTGSTLPAWRARAESEPWGRSVRFLGFRTDVPQVVGSCDLLISPTRYEAYGLNVHEAICQGLPAIVSAEAGVAERFPAQLAQDWLLPDPRDPSDLAQRLIRWREGVGSAKRAFQPLAIEFRRRSWDDCADEIAAFPSG